METELRRPERTGVITDGYGWIKALFGKISEKALEVGKKIKEVGQDDPRRIVHSFKVGLALTLVSLFYYVRPLYNGFESSGMWAVFTVVVVFEFTIGATLSKCMNRGFATLAAGALGVGVNQFASLLGDKGEPIILAFFVFLLAAASTYTRFIPHIKARYDYGVLIFILTFSLVSISGYRVDQIIELAHQRLSTVLIGNAICIIISVFFYPVWAGEDLHNLVATNLEKLSDFLQEFGSEYFGGSGDGQGCLAPKEDKSFLEGYKTVLNTKTKEETLANFAWWEPRHGSFKFRHPWKKYLEIGVLTRQCAYHIDALNAYLNSTIQAPPEFQRKIEEPCKKMSTESGKALKELALAIETFSHPSFVDLHIESSKRATGELKSSLRTVSKEKDDLLKIIPSLTVASLLTDIVKCVEKITESIHELSQQAEFKYNIGVGIQPSEKPQKLHQGIIKSIDDGRDGDGDGDHVVVSVHGTSSESPENGFSQASKSSQTTKL